MFWISFRIVISCVLLLSVSGEPACAQQKAMTVDRAVKLFAGLEREYKALEWTLEFSRGQLRDASDVSSVLKSDGSRPYRATVRFDPQARRYLVTTQEVSPWQGRPGESVPAPFVAINRSRGFDGRVHRSSDQQAHAKDLEKANLERAKQSPNLGLVMDREYDNVDFVNNHAAGMAFGLMPPNVFDWDLPPMPLSKMLERRQKAGAKVEVTEDESGIVHVRYRWTKPDEPVPTFSVFDGRFDVKKGGVCLGWTISQGFVKGDVAETEIPWKRCEFDNFEAAPGLWAPREINIVSAMERPPFVDKLTLTDVRVNPPLDAKAFILEFPTGTYVDDHIANKSYTVTGGAIDEQAAVKEFITRHKLQARPRRAAWFSWSRLAILMSLFAAVGAVFAWRRGLGVVLMVIALNSESMGAEPGANALVPEAENRETEATADYIISHHPAERIRVAECGFTVSLFALEHFGISYELAHVKSALRQTDRGIRLGDIHELLLAYGLACEARQNVDPVALQRSVQDGYLAIFPIRTGKNSDHFLVALLGENEEPKAVDVLRRVTPLRDLVFDSHLSVYSGVVLLVRAADSRPARDRTLMGGRVRATPAVVELGAFPLDGPEGMVKRRAEVVLENTSSKPVLIKSVIVACGCTDLDWKGGVIRAGAKQPVSVTARPVAWGAGKQRKGMTFKFLDDSELKVEVVGEGQTVQQVQQVTVAPQQLRYEIGADAIAGKVPLTRDLSVTGESESLDVLRVTSTATWLTAEIATSTERSRRVQARVSVQDALLQLQADESSELSGELKFSTKEGAHPLVVPVTVIPKEFFTATARRLEMELGTDSEVEFLPLAKEAKSISISTVQSDPPGLVFEKQTVEHGAKLLVRGEAATPPGLYVVRCQLQSDSKRIATMDLIVRVKPKLAGAATEVPDP